MPPLIYSLVPNSYHKKPLKASNELDDLDNFITELRKRIVESWNYEFQVDNSNGSGYKIKFEQFEKRFLKKSDFVFYVVNSISVEAFRNCIKKLVKSCKEVEKLSKIVVLSLNTPSFEELNCTPIGFVYFGDAWKSENDNQWTTLDGILKSKINCNSNKDEIPKTDSIPIPNSNNGRKSPSRIKSFFNSLPSRFDSDRKRANSGRDCGVPDINILDVEDVKIEDKRFTLPRRQKADSTKLSLNSLFRRRSKKTRDSGLSMDSSNSTGSGSRKSDTIITRGSLLADEAMNGKANTLFVSGQESVVLTASLNKTEHHKAKIEMFKDKANKVIRSTSCLKSPKEKKSKCIISDVMGDVVNFSSVLMTASSNIGNHSEKIGKKNHDLMNLLNARGQSEPPLNNFRNLSTDSIPNRRIKYYSWTEDSSEEREFDADELVCKDFEKTSSILNQNTDENDTESNKLEHLKGIIFNTDEEHIDKLHHHLSDKESISVEPNITLEDESEVFFTTFKPTNAELNEYENQIIMTHSDPDVSYSSFVTSDIAPYPNNDNVHRSDDSGVSPDEEIEENISLSSENEDTIMNDPMASLNKLIESIQMGYEEKREARKNQPCNNIEMKIKNDNSVHITSHEETEQVEVNDIVPVQRIELESNANLLLGNDFNLVEAEILPEIDNQITPKHEMSPELIEVADSISNSHNLPTSSVRSSYQSLIRNPLFVTGLFAATTYTAPMWCTIIPRNVCLSKLFYGTLDYLMYGNIVQSIPNQIISTGRSGAFAASNTLKRFLILLPTPWFNTYKVVPA